MTQIKRIVVGCLAMIMMLSCVGVINASAISKYESSTNNTYNAYGRYGQHNLTSIGATKVFEEKHVLWEHTIYSTYSNTKLYAFCMDYGKKSRSYYRDRNGGTYDHWKWPEGTVGNTNWGAIHKILRYGAIYMVNDVDKRYNYLTMQALTWAAIPNKNLPGTAYVTLKVNPNDDYTYSEPVFSKKADEFAANIILQKSLSHSKDSEPKDPDWCKTCNGYGYVYDYEITCYWGWYSWGPNYSNGDSDSYIINVTNKTEDWNYQDDYKDYDYYSGGGISGYNNWRYYSVTSKTKKDCPNPDCDLENYQEYNKNQSFIKDYDDKYWDLWTNYCDMKYYMHIMSQVPSYTRKTKANSQSNNGMVRLYWNDNKSRFEVIVSDTNLVSAQDITANTVDDDIGTEDAVKADGDAYGYFFADYDGYHFTYYKGKTLIWWNNSDDRSAKCKPEDYTKANPVTISTICSAMQNNLAELVYWHQIFNNSASAKWQNLFTIVLAPNSPQTEAFLTLNVESPYNGKAECSSNVKIELVDINNEVVDHIIPGEKYKVRYTYIYSGGSKGYGMSKQKDKQYDWDYDTLIDKVGGIPIYGTKNGTYTGHYYEQEMKRLTNVSLIGIYSVYK